MYEALSDFKFARTWAGDVVQRLRPAMACVEAWLPPIALKTGNKLLEIMLRVAGIVVCCVPTVSLLFVAPDVSKHCAQDWSARCT